jgi:hypothetical protein
MLCFEQGQFLVEFHAKQRDAGAEYKRRNGEVELIHDAGSHKLRVNTGAPHNGQAVGAFAG